MPEIELTQGVVRYRDQGAGPPIVLIHTLLVNGNVGDRLVPLLAAHGTITPSVAAIGAVLATAVSVLANVVFAARVSRDTGLRKHLTLTMTVLAVLGIVGAVVQNVFVSLTTHS